MSKSIKNNTVSAKTYGGQEIVPGEYFEIPFQEERLLANNLILQSDITSGDIIVNDGNKDLNNIEGLSYLKIDTTKICSLFHHYEIDGTSPIFDSGQIVDTWIPVHVLRTNTDLGGAISRIKLPIINIIDAGDDTLVIAGDHTELFKKDNSFKLVDSNVNDGIYAIKDDSTLNGGNTEIKLQGGVVNPLTIDGNILTGCFNVIGTGFRKLSSNFVLDGNSFNVHFAFFKNGTRIAETEHSAFLVGAGKYVDTAKEGVLVILEDLDKLELRFKVSSGTNKEFILKIGEIRLESLW